MNYPNPLNCKPNYHQVKERSAPNLVPNFSMPITSKEVTANDPSSEFSFTWQELGGDTGFFYRTREDAEKAANENFHNFKGAMADRKVYIVKVLNILGQDN